MTYAMAPYNTSWYMNKKSLENLINIIIAFNKERGWISKPSDVSKSIIIESSELLEHFQWDESFRDAKKIKDWEAIKEEVADVFWYLVTFCNSTNIDLSKAVMSKIDKNGKKYPARLFNGKYNHKVYINQKHKYRK